MSIPETMANWFSETMRPRMRKGVTSAMYIGEVIEAAPMPIPPIKRKTMNWASVRGRAVPRAETKKARPATIRTFLRPKRSLKNPAAPAPSAQPSRALAAEKPSQNGVKSKRVFKKPVAPAMTAVS